MVPPVASRSSTASTRWPGLIASSWMASASRPYSSSYSTSMVLPGSLPSLRTGTKPALQLVGDRAADDEASRLDPDHHVDPLALIPAGQRVDGEAPRRAVLEERGDVLEEDALGREVLDVADLGPELGDVHAPHTR